MEVEVDVALAGEDSEPEASFAGGSLPESVLSVLAYPAVDGEVVLADPSEAFAFGDLEEDVLEVGVGVAEGGGRSAKEDDLDEVAARELKGGGFVGDGLVASAGGTGDSGGGSAAGGGEG